MDVRDIAGKVLQKAMKERPDGAEIFCVSATSTTAEARAQQVDALEAASDRGVGLRVLLENRIGFAYSSSVDADALERLVGEAFASARSSEPDPANNLPDLQSGYPEVVTEDPALREIPETQIVDWAMEMEKAALERDRRIRTVRKAAVSLGYGEKCILSSSGIDVCVPYTVVSASLMAMAEEGGDSQSGWEFDYSRSAGKLDVRKVGEAAADRAVGLLGARSIGSDSVPVILENSVTADFLGVMASSFCADNVLKGKSLLAGREGSAVASALVTIVDDGLMPGGLATSPADDEGVPRMRQILVEDGILQGYLNDSYTARRTGSVSTGNAVRGGFKSVPSVGISNFFIQPGAVSLEALLDVDKGLFVTEAMGVHTANPISGDFSIGVSGFWVEKGKLVHPVRGVVIAGNLIEMMKNVDLVAKDLRFFGRVGAPAVRVHTMSISGKS